MRMLKVDIFWGMADKVVSIGNWLRPRDEAARSWRPVGRDRKGGLWPQAALPRTSNPAHVSRQALPSGRSVLRRMVRRMLAFGRRGLRGCLETLSPAVAEAIDFARAEPARC